MLPSTMSPLPPEEERILSLLLEKKVTAGHLLWQKRQLVITSQALLFARPGVDMTIDRVPLLAIKSIRNIRDPDDVSGDMNLIVIALRETELEPDKVEGRLIHELQRPEPSSEKVPDLSGSDESIAKHGTMPKKSLLRTASLTLQQSITRPASQPSMASKQSESKVFTLRAKTSTEARVFVEALEKACAESQAQVRILQSRREKVNEILRKVHKSRRLQYSVFTLILLNFLVNCLNFELLPEPDSAAQAVFDNVDLFFTIIFTAELFLNMYVSGLRKFVFVPFNIIDLIIIILSWVAVLGQSMSNVSVLRLFRVGRIVRLARSSLCVRGIGGVGVRVHVRVRVYDRVRVCDRVRASAHVLACQCRCQ